MWDVVGNSEDRFSHNEVQLSYVLVSESVIMSCNKTTTHKWIKYDLVKSNKGNAIKSMTYLFFDQ